MTPETLLGWMELGLERAARELGCDPEQWWPRSQAEATTWVWATMFEASTLVDVSKPTTLCAPLSIRYPERQRLLDEWLGKGGGLRHFYKGHDLLDFTMKHYQLSAPNVLSAESEMCEAHSVDCTIERMGDYAWDFFKLLQVPSRYRLMFARVGAGGGNVSPRERRAALIEGLKGLTEKYAKQFLREGDEVGIVVFAVGGRDPWDDVRCAVGVQGPGGVRWSSSDVWPGWGRRPTKQ